MSDENRKQVVDKTEVVVAYMNKLNQELETKPRHEDASMSLEAVDIMIEMLEAECKAIFALPPPKREEPKKEETAADDLMDAVSNEGVDAEMKDEGASEPKAE